MKFNPNVTKSRKKNRKRYFLSSSQEKRKIMSSPLSKELKLKYFIKSIPIRKEDEILVVRGLHKGEIGKVVQCQRKIFKILIDKINRMKSNKTNVFIPISPSNVVITKLILNSERKNFLEKKKNIKKNF
ncbi:rpl26 (nucleomorph) [Hemiselmis andersenii]|uniref:Rpl26 n=1 Tax=Hemiselmis andersenii TaxID=464988 RepID=A9BKS4_HEMAN|nr:rpl26 [Hemiselmis andersenii]ABW98079.1 rpl26 [Hemiselmis andersenii]|mmetsp:Transcript_27026/g.65753  ORF Transcript_27026/g.65753 Transcript_27026/m.65753 type:complete len:129 (-) Transcript_27026:177-563(-)